MDYSNVKYSTTKTLIKCNSSLPKNAAKLDGGLRKAGFCKSSNNTAPLITIITANFNDGRHLEQTILSVLRLEYDNIEYIVIDGGSKDESVQVLKKYEHAIDYWRSEPDRGIYDAMNKGWDIANEHAFILFLGSGDTIKSLPSDMTVYKKEEIIYGNVILSENKVFTSVADSRLRFRNTLHHQALLINKSIHTKPPFNINYKINADFDFNQRLFKMHYKFTKAENFLAGALPHGISSTINFEKFNIVKKNYGIFSAFLALIFDLCFILRKIVYPIVKTTRISI
ncbi:MAG: glycosyltransferase [Planctomycetaceae bacterium]|nr:glycosyltransferase [Planctomycetaceae bacterium]